MATTDALTDTALRKARGQAKPYKLADGRGLHAEVRPNGAIWWRFRYRFGGVEKMLSLGTYPDTSLKLARERCDAARRLLSEGTDPSQARQEGKSAVRLATEVQALTDAGKPLPGTFEHLARAWHAVKRDQWSDTYGRAMLGRLERGIFPTLGKLPAASIKPPQVLKALRLLEDAGVLETAERTRQACSQVFRYGVSIGEVESDPARDLAGALKRATVKHLASLTDPQDFGALLRSIDAYRGGPVVRVALRLAPLVFLRPGQELRGARWEEIDLAGATWQVPAIRMKRPKDGKINGNPHIVPLSRQAVELLQELHPVTGHGDLVFPNERKNGRPMSENTLNTALDALGYGAEQMRAHGFRAAARTLLHERLGIAPEVIEHQLAHRVPDALGRAYNRTEFLDQRRQMMQAWADYCDRLRAGAEVLTFPPAAKA